MKNIVIAPVGDNLDPLFIGIKEFNTEKVILVTPGERVHIANQAKKDLDMTVTVEPTTPQVPHDRSQTY